ncbi:MAG: hypothetical protein HOG03_19640 [Desulfobacula sp.]|jgi:hypothetical protein|uniref:toxin TumE n=1 Tax=Desulfobacula sp. TaxID=2593537 RepID=UPI001D89EEEB|nr:hypothetical protein [Desulfobacula sp.]MBT3486480.1 hypothetical protein [Desulfobacula sp.]MBT3806783.1 hypothetical protein [Desulfobacula sp.]MBT4027078.1 hypothetical protein [Desulfobacula sp.]MBT4197878.1 hypothetical protein [Desulfobacula sp.]
MLLDLLSEYLNKIEARILKLENVYVERYEEEIIVNNRINLRIRIRFKTGYLLELNEAIIAETATLKRLYYRYHFQDDKNNLIFRYDNAPHFPGFTNFPNHKHLPDEVTDVSETSILKVIEEARSTIQEKP